MSMQRVDLYPAELPAKWFGGSWIKASVLVALAVLLMIFSPWFVNSGALSTQMKVAVNHDADYVQSLSQTVQPVSQLSHHLDDQLKQANYIGTALIVRHGQIVLQAGYGQADYQKNRPNTAQSLYHIASLEKAMTAALIVQQIEAGKLTYETKLSRFYPGVVNASKITIRQLLTMTSGLRQEKQPQSFESQADNVAYSARHADQVASPGDGAAWSYQPVNYRLLAGIVMQLTHSKFSTVFNQIFNDQYHLDIVGYQDFNRNAKMSLGYQENLDSPVAVSLVEKQRETGTGNVAMSTGMLYRFYRLVFDQKLVEHPQQMLQTMPPATYASGMYQQPNNCRTAHGIFNGYEPSVVISNDGQNAVILLSNQYYKGHSFEELSHHLYQEVVSTSSTR